MYTTDSENNILNGANKYSMTFKEEIPYSSPGFWSITLYDATNNYTVRNPINRYRLGSDTPNLKKEKDGSFTLYIQTENPGPDKESNWLPAPKGPFYLTPRSYAPKQQAIKLLEDVHVWPVPEIIRVP